MKKKLISLVLAVLLISSFTIGCASTNTAPCNCGCDCSRGIGESDLSYVMGKEWKLIQVHVNDTFSREVLFDRKTLSKEDAGNIFILKLEKEMLSGTAAPNNYTGPYTVNEVEKTITVMPMRTTLMASIWQPEKLREQDYFTYLNNAYKWSVSNGRLLINSKTAEGKEIVLTYE